MDSRCFFITLLFAALPTFKSVGLTCYVCMWVNNNDICGDNGFALTPDLSGYYMLNCTVCYKYVKFNAKGDKMQVLRGCARSEWAYEPICQTTRYLKGLSTQVCACTSDYCNNVSSPYFFLNVSLLVAFVYVFAVFLN